MQITKAEIFDFYERFFNQQELNLAKKWIAFDYIQHNPGIAQGRSGLIQAFQQKFSSGEYFHLIVERIVLEDNYAAVFLRSVDEQQQTKAHVVDLYRIANHQFAEHWDYFDKERKDEHD